MKPIIPILKLSPINSALMSNSQDKNKDKEYLVPNKIFGQDFSCEDSSGSFEHNKVVIFDFDCTISGNDAPKETSTLFSECPRDSSESINRSLGCKLELKASIPCSTSGFPAHHFYHATHNEECGKKICQIFTEAERQKNLPTTMHPEQIDWCKEFFGSNTRLQKLKELFKAITIKGFQIIILTRGCSWHVGCILRIVDLLKYITSIGGNSSIKCSTLWLNVIDNMLVIDATKKYLTKDREILRLLENGFMVRYIDDDPEEHFRILKVVNKLSSRKYNYGNIGKSGSICRDANIRKNCIKFPDFKKNGRGMTIEMMSKLIEVCT